jgi:hypothetical protein
LVDFAEPGIVHATGGAVLQVAREFVGDSDCDPAAVAAKGCSHISKKYSNGRYTDKIYIFGRKSEFT